MSTGAMIVEDLEILFTLTVEPRPGCFVPECSCEAVWNIFWEYTCPVHLGNPTPYCNNHKLEVEGRIPFSLRRGFKCRICSAQGVHNLLGHIVKIERISV